MTNGPSDRGPLPPPTRRSLRSATRDAEPTAGQGPRPDPGFVPGRFARPGLPVPAATASSSLRRTLTLIVLLLAVAHVAGLALLWPSGPARTVPGATAVYAGVVFPSGTVREVISKSCAGTTDTRRPDGTIPAVTTCVSAVVAVADGPDAGRSQVVGVPAEVARSGLAPGVRVTLARYPAIPGAPVTYAFQDYARAVPLGLLAGLLLVLVIAVARWRGLLALVGLGLAFLAIGLFVLPALRRDENPTLVAAVAAGAIMMLVLYLAHGVSTKTTTALLGTLAGIWTTAGLATWATDAAHLNGLSSEDNLALSRLTTGAGLDGLVLAGIVLAGLGVLNDVTITQASAVWELRRHAAHLTARGLFVSGMRIGRDHLASTIYTVAFAYAGVALPALMLFDLYGQPLNELINSNAIGEEIARTLVASIGLVLSVPLTTAIAATIAARTAPDALPPPSSHPH